jgi:hypothetical protein
MFLANRIYDFGKSYIGFQQIKNEMNREEKKCSCPSDDGRKKENYH